MTDDSLLAGGTFGELWYELRDGTEAKIGSLIESVREATDAAYNAIHERIITLELPPGTPINVADLAQELAMDLVPVWEALILLDREGLIQVSSEHGITVRNVYLSDLAQLSQMRLTLEALSARWAAENSSPEDLETLGGLARELTDVPADDPQRLFEVDHRFHSAVALASGNRYLYDQLERFFGLSQRLWNLALPQLDFLPAAVREHLDLVEAIKAGDADRAAAVMHAHVEGFYDRVSGLLTAQVTVTYGSDERSVVVEQGGLLGGAVVATGLPLEQPCAGRGTCGKCKVLVDGILSPPDQIEKVNLTAAELTAGYRLACRARVHGKVSVTLAPIVVYSNKIFRTSDAYKRSDAPLGLAIDLGSTTVAAFVMTLDDGEVCAGAAGLNRQTIFGSDVISRLAEADQGEANAERLSALALASIRQAIDALRLSRRVLARVKKVTVVGNCAMHHLLLRYPVDTLAVIPFQPHDRAAVRMTDGLFKDVVPTGAEVALPPLIGGFVGSDALACLAYFGFDRAPGPMAAIDLGTNGEVMVTDGERILVASTAAGPAFEGVNISCGTRAVDGAVVGVTADHKRGRFDFVTIAGAPPVGLTGSGLLSTVCELRRANVIDESGRMVAEHPVFGHRISVDANGMRRISLTDGEGDDVLYLTQGDVRELQKAKGAILAATETLMARLNLEPKDLQRMILTGSFGSQLNIEAVVGLGMIPPVDLGIVETPANGAGLGAALFLDDEEFTRGERIATAAEQVDLDLDPDFNRRYIESLSMPGRRRPGADQA
jgi:uncharacterized 2Fe-2S/4Fe-4S cluster protein (DUF4445 family)/DNA-binding GntR family transcriptional regulator